MCLPGKISEDWSRGCDQNGKIWLAARVILPCGDSCWVNCWVIGSLLPPRGVLWSLIPHIASDRLIIVTGFNRLQTTSTG